MSRILKLTLPATVATFGLLIFLAKPKDPRTESSAGVPPAAAITEAPSAQLPSDTPPPAVVLPASSEPSTLTHVTRLVATDLNAALAYTKELKDPAQREACFEVISVELSRTDPMQAIEIAANHLPSLRSHTTIAHAARNWAARSPSEVALWAADLESETLRETVLRAIAPELAHFSPASAAEIIDATTTDQAREQTLALIAQRQKTASAQPTE